MLIIFATASPEARGINVDIDGVDGRLKENILLYLHTVPPPVGDSIGGYKKQLQLKAAQALKPLGHYHPVIALSSSRQQDTLNIQLQVTPGPVMVIDNIDIQLTGAATEDPAFATLLAEQPLRPGMPLLHSDYESLKGELISLALERGYFDSRWLTHEIQVRLQTNSASLVLHLDTGQRYHFGPVRVSETNQAGSSDTEAFVLSMAPFSQGDPFEAGKLAAYHLALSNSRYFSRIQILPRQQAHKGHQLPIEVQLTKKPANSVELGGGVSSNVGVRGKIKWHKPWVNRHGHSVGAQVDLSGKKQSLSAAYKLPIDDPINNYAEIVTGWQQINNRDTDSRKFTLQFQRHWLLASQWHRTAFVKLEQEDFRQGGEPFQSQYMIMPGISYGRTRARGDLNIHWGDRQQLSLVLSHPGWGSDVELAKFRLQSKWLRTYGDTHQWILKADLGAIVVDNITSVPASMRFFTGGDDNLRGFDFETVTPLNDREQDSGGLYLATSSLEYSYPVADKWRLAAFVDVGTATNDFSEQLSSDIGLGIRWQTPVGPLRVDLAFPLSHDEQEVSDFRLSFSIGPAL